MKVVDASVVMKWLDKDELDSEKAFSLYQAHVLGELEIVVPQLLFLEIANALATKSHTTEQAMSDGLNILLRSKLHVCQVTSDIIRTTASLAKQYHTSVYDMLYLVVAEQSHAELISADKKFVSKVGKAFPFVTLLGDIQ